MSSRRFPGKVLAPFRGRPLIAHVIGAARAALPGTDPIVVTSDEASDTPLVAYLTAEGIPCFRGPLDDVLARLVACLDRHPCDWVLRVCGDSPLLSPALLRTVVERRSDDAELVTTTAPRTFPRGQNAELIRSSALRDAAAQATAADDREHVTPWLHRRGKLVSVRSTDASLASHSIAVDTIEDLQRLEALDAAELERLRTPPIAEAVH
jgi:spore coat polysaccharide biosynthesis protein SpsF